MTLRASTLGQSRVRRLSEVLRARPLPSQVLGSLDSYSMETVTKADDSVLGLNVQVLCGRRLDIDEAIALQEG